VNDNRNANTRDETMKITSKCRNAVAGCSTGSGSDYYTTKGDAAARIMDTLADFGYLIAQDYFWDMPGDNGRIAADIEDTTSMLVLSWHRMEVAGNYEITTYVS
jgi:hypothetical protein